MTTRPSDWRLTMRARVENEFWLPAAGSVLVTRIVEAGVTLVSIDGFLTGAARPTVVVDFRTTDPSPVERAAQKLASIPADETTVTFDIRQL